MMTLLLLGFLIGMRHALEADHVAAVATLATRADSFADTIRQGTFWGIGHTITLVLFGSAVIWMDEIMPQQVALALESAVGVMLVILGFDVIRRLVRDRVHFHRHRHGNRSHFHAHSHAGESGHDDGAHSHSHAQSFPLRALLIGLMHGMAGSAALIILTLETIHSPLQGMLYMLLFGLGSMLGMALLSAVIAIPLRHSARGLTWLHNGLQLVIGVATIMIGFSTLA
ncbi:MAG: sulfite exporter TauE/SafE family protein [Gammaproteobacteria bacterium]